MGNRGAGQRDNRAGRVLFVQGGRGAKGVEGGEVRLDFLMKIYENTRQTLTGI